MNEKTVSYRLCSVITENMIYEYLTSKIPVYLKIDKDTIYLSQDEKGSDLGLDNKSYLFSGSHEDESDYIESVQNGDLANSVYAAIISLLRRSGYTIIEDYETEIDDDPVTSQWDL